MKLCLNEKIVSSYNSNVTFQKFSTNMYNDDEKDNRMGRNG